MVKPTSKHAEEMQKIRESIERYECEDAERKALSRIARNEIALGALADMQLTECQLSEVILSYVQAANISRNFKAILAREGTMPERLKKATGAVAILRKFVKEIPTRSDDFVSAWIVVDDEEKRGYLQALYEIERLINNRLEIAKQTPVRIGATRKRSSKVAAENGGIGWLAASIKRITGHHHDLETCRLAEALVGIEEISEDRLRGALRNFTDRNWRG